MEQQLEQELTKLWESAILGGYNPKARMQAMENRFEEAVQVYQNKAEDTRIRLEESKIMDPTRKLLFRATANITALEKDINAFNGIHYNLKYRQLKEKCAKYQIELDQIHGEGPIRQEKRGLLQRIEEIEQKLLNKMAAPAGHDPANCAECQ